MTRLLLRQPIFGVLFFLLLTAPAFWSCSSETAYTKSLRQHEDAYKVIDNDTIQSYIRRNGYLNSVQQSATGLAIVTLTQGAGTPITAGKQVRVKYIGRFLGNSYSNSLFPPNGIFDNSSENHSDCGCAIFTAGASPLAGFNEGMLQLREGDRKVLLIPSRLAYGPTGQANAANTGYTIPPDAVLAFDIEVLNIL
jgi:FKBP-type peptidyl-prolyl cis-trans isomerase